MADKKKILVLEDEQRAGDKLIGMLNVLDPELDLHWCRSVSEGIDFLKKNEDLDLIFSDIELVDGKAFTIYAEVSPNCPIIFCTAYDNFYVSAFKTNGIAYLLKPYSIEELKEVWEKYLLLFANSLSQGVSDTVLQSIKSMLGESKSNYKESFTVKKKDGVFLLKTTDVVYFQAQGDFVLAYNSSGARNVINLSLSKVEESVNPKDFIQINRSEIVQKEAIEKYAPYTKNRLAVHLKSSEIVLYTSNSRSPEFRAWFEGG